MPIASAFENPVGRQNASAAPVQTTSVAYPVGGFTPPPGSAPFTIDSIDLARRVVVTSDGTRDLTDGEFKRIARICKAALKRADRARWSQYDDQLSLVSRKKRAPGAPRPSRAKKSVQPTLPMEAAPDAAMAEPEAGAAP